MTYKVLPRLRPVMVAVLVAASLFAVARPAEAYRRRRVRVVHPYGYRTTGYYRTTGAVVVGPSFGNWYGGAGLFGTRILHQEGGTEALESGGGLSVYGGLAVNDTLSLELGWMGSLHNPATVSTWYGPETDYLVLDAFTADARIHFSRNGNVSPYVQGGVGLYALGSQHVGIDSIGSGFQLGGGFDWHVSDHWTLGLRARYHGIAMGPPNGRANDVFISAATVEGSLAVHF